MAGQGIQIDFAASEAVREAIVRLGRTEDLHFAPGSTRIAIAGLYRSKILVLDVSFDVGARTVTVDDYVEVSSSAFNHPHGVFWLDAETMVIANRRGTVTFIPAPPIRSNSHSVEVAPLATIGRDDVDLLRGPGSLAAIQIAPGTLELLVCNNFGDFISQHLIERSNGSVRPTNQSIFAAKELYVLDGAAYSPSGKYVAASSHHNAAVVIYRNDAGANRLSEPAGILTGVKFPHGLRFSPDGRFLLVADAGAPVVHIFHSEDGDWSGTREVVQSVRVMNDATFKAGNYRAAEGGPKGLDMDETGTILGVTCDTVPLAFFDIGAVLDGIGAGRGPAVRDHFPELESVTRARHEAAEAERTSLPAIRRELQALRYRGLMGKLRRVKHWYESRPR